METKKRKRKVNEETDPLYRVIDTASMVVLKSTYNPEDIQSLVDYYSVHCAVGVEAFVPFVLEDPDYGSISCVAHTPYTPFQA